MKNKCDCYCVQRKKVYTYHPVTGQPIGHDVGVSVCYGTKEMDECSCGGDEMKCDFYPDVRKKAKLGWVDVEFAISGCAYLDNDTEKMCYMISSKEEDIYSFVATSRRDNIYPSKVLHMDADTEYLQTL